MNLLPLPTRLPARKHVLAASMVVLSVSLMAAAVLGAAGLPSPFRAGGAAKVSTNGVLVNAPNSTTTIPPTTSVSLAPVNLPRGITSPPTTRPTTGTGPAPTGPRQTTTTTVVPVTTPPILPPIPGLDGTQGGSIFGF
jgi:hypothetical protein